MVGDFESVLVSRERIAERVRAIGRELAADLIRDLRAEGHDPDESGHVVMLPILTGSLVFVADLIREMPMKLSIEMTTVTSYPGKSMESQGAELRGELPEDLSGRHVVIVDDILDSGRTLKLVRHEIEKRNPASVRACMLLHKIVEGRPCEASAEYVGFEIPDEFVVGYGLDYDGLYRNHPEIVTLRRDAL